MINCYVITKEDKLNSVFSHLLQHPLTKLVGWYDGIPTRYSDLLDLSVHIVFIDCDMIGKFKKLIERSRSKVSFVYLSNNTEFAFQAFEDEVLDYVTYPVEFKRFERVVNKFVRFCLMLPSADKSKTVSSSFDSFFVKPDPKAKVEVLVNACSVLFVEAFHNDIVIQMEDGKRYLCAYTIKEMEESLSNCFIRVHRSFLVNYKKISAFDGTNIIIDANQQYIVPLGGVYKKSFLDRRRDMLIKKTSKTFESYSISKAINYFLILMAIHADFTTDIINI
ncbi:LytR/AlgR family response regulator transcription factor [Pedobacter sp.]